MLGKSHFSRFSNDYFGVKYSKKLQKARLSKIGYYVFVLLPFIICVLSFVNKNVIKQTKTLGVFRLEPTEQ